MKNWAEINLCRLVFLLKINSDYTDALETLTKINVVIANTHAWLNRQALCVTKIQNFSLIRFLSFLKHWSCSFIFFIYWIFNKSLFILFIFISVIFLYIFTARDRTVYYAHCTFFRKKIYEYPCIVNHIHFLMYITHLCLH